jgi:hypothetical protein
VKDVARADTQLRHPTAVLDLGTAELPVLDEIDPYVYVRGIEGHIMDKPTTMDNPGSAVVSFIMGHAPRLLRRLDLLEQRSMIVMALT